MVMAMVNTPQGLAFKRIHYDQRGYAQENHDDAR